MPVLELTQLRLKAVTVDDPKLLENLSAVRDELQTHSQFFHCIEDANIIFILGIWPSLEHHHDFLASPRRDEVLGPQESMLEFISSAHMHLDAMSELPLDAPVMAITRFSIKADGADAYSQAVTGRVQRLAAATRPHSVVNGWRCDPMPGNFEAFLFSGWESTQTHAAWSAAEVDHLSAIVQSSSVWHARNMEGRPVSTENTS